jgi:hypothetical protein
VSQQVAQHSVHADGWILTAKKSWFWLWVLSVSWASLVPPAAGNASRWAFEEYCFINIETFTSF